MKKSLVLVVLFLAILTIQGNASSLGQHSSERVGGAIYTCPDDYPPCACQPLIPYIPAGRAEGQRFTLKVKREANVYWLYGVDLSNGKLYLEPQFDLGCQGIRAHQGDIFESDLRIKGTNAGTVYRISTDGASPFYNGYIPAKDVKVIGK